MDFNKDFKLDFKMDFISAITKRAIDVNRHGKKIVVFAETDDKILMASSLLIKKSICHPLILGNADKIVAALQRLKIRNFTEENYYDYLDPKHKNDITDFTKLYLDSMKAAGKKLSQEQGVKNMSMPHYYAAMMVEKGLADGMISGINSETKPYHPAFEIIKTREGITRASGLFIMMHKKQLFLFADCALNIDPDAKQLAEIAMTTSDTAIGFGIKPRIAMLSFSTRGSAKHEMVDKVRNATDIVKSKDHDIIIDGELQLDAAIIPEVAKKKCPDSVLAGNANILIFPDLNSANISYKLVQRLGGFTAIGPIMQGLNKPVNDLSRGASVQDIVDLAAITVVQSL